MASSGQLTGMRGVYLAAAELSRLGFIVSPTSRGSLGADLLVTDQSCKRAYSVQVKTDAKIFNFWLLNKNAKELISRSHIYVLVNLRSDGSKVEYFIVPSRIISEKMYVEKGGWYSFSIEDAERFRNKWKVFGLP